VVREIFGGIWDDNRLYLTRAEAIRDIALHASKMGLLPIGWSEIDEKLTIGRTHKSGNADLIFGVMVRSAGLPLGWRLVPDDEPSRSDWIS
jgi:hypothetical protein